MLSCINDYKDAVWSIREREKKNNGSCSEVLFQKYININRGQYGSNMYYND